MAPSKSHEQSLLGDHFPSAPGLCKADPAFPGGRRPLGARTAAETGTQPRALAHFGKRLWGRWGRAGSTCPARGRHLPPPWQAPSHAADPSDGMGEGGRVPAEFVFPLATQAALARGSDSRGDKETPPDGQRSFRDPALRLSCQPRTGRVTGELPPSPTRPPGTETCELITSVPAAYERAAFSDEPLQTLPGLQASTLGSRAACSALLTREEGAQGDASPHWR